MAAVEGSPRRVEGAELGLPRARAGARPRARGARAPRAARGPAPRLRGLAAEGGVARCFQMKVHWDAQSAGMNRSARAQLKARRARARARARVLCACAGRGRGRGVPRTQHVPARTWFARPAPRHDVAKRSNGRAAGADGSSSPRVPLTRRRAPARARCRTQDEEPRRSSVLMAPLTPPRPARCRQRWICGAAASGDAGDACGPARPQPSLCIKVAHACKTPAATHRRPAEALAAWAAAGPRQPVVAASAVGCTKRSPRRCWTRCDVRCALAAARARTNKPAAWKVGAGGSAGRFALGPRCSRFAAPRPRPHRHTNCTHTNAQTHQ